MEILGKIKKILETKSFSSGFKKKELVIITEDKYPQHILVEFLQEKISLLDGLKINDNIKIYINIRGREWINPEGIIKYYNYIQGWRIEKLKNNELTSYRSIYYKNLSSKSDDFYDLPF
jgi:hypothetical protein